MQYDLNVFNVRFIVLCRFVCVYIYIHVYIYIICRPLVSRGHKAVVEICSLLWIKENNTREGSTPKLHGFTGGCGGVQPPQTDPRIRDVFDATAMSFTGLLGVVVCTRISGRTRGPSRN